MGNLADKAPQRAVDSDLDCAKCFLDAVVSKIPI